MDVQAELGKAIASRKPGRENREEVIVFDSTGTALPDVAVVMVTLTRVGSSDHSFWQCPHYSKNLLLSALVRSRAFSFPHLEMSTKELKRGHSAGGHGTQRSDKKRSKAFISALHGSLVKTHETP